MREDMSIFPVGPEKNFPLSVFNAISGTGAFIAGGAARYAAGITDIPAYDIDVYCRKQNDQEVVEALVACGAVFQRETETSQTFWSNGRHVQVIRARTISYGDRESLTYGSPEDVIGDFDLTVTMAAIISRTQILVGCDFVRDETSRIARVHQFQTPIATLARLVKYAKKGYTVPDAQLALVAKAFSARYISDRRYREFIDDPDHSKDHFVFCPYERLV